MIRLSYISPNFSSLPLSRTLLYDPHPRFSNGLRPRAFCASDLFPTLPSLPTVLYETERVGRGRVSLRSDFGTRINRNAPTPQGAVNENIPSIER